VVSFRLTADEILKEVHHSALQFRARVSSSRVKRLVKRMGNRLLGVSNNFVDGTHFADSSPRQSRENNEHFQRVKKVIASKRE